MKRQWGIGVGAASILIIFVLLCLTVFATLSLVSAQADLRLAGRAAETTAAYYEADGRAVELLCALDETAEAGSLTELHACSVSLLTGALLDNRQSGGELALRYQVPIDENRAIEVELRYTTDANGRITRQIEGWRTVQTGGFAPEGESLTLWQGGLSGLPNLEEVP